MLPNVTVAVASSLPLGSRRVDHLRPLARRHRAAAANAADLPLGGGPICILKLLDYLIDQFAALLFATGKGSETASATVSRVQACRILLLFAIGLPYMIVAAATYRPKGLSEMRPTG